MQFPTSAKLVDELAEMLDVPINRGVDLDVRLQVLDDDTWHLHYGDAQYDTDCGEMAKSPSPATDRSAWATPS